MFGSKLNDFNRGFVPPTPPPPPPPPLDDPSIVPGYGMATI